MAKPDFLSFMESGAEFSKTVLKRAEELKATPREEQLVHNGKSVLLFFEKPSTRTRLSFEAAAHQLGAQSIFLSPATSQATRGETIEDTARMFGLFCDAVAVRTNSHERLGTIARYCSAPVINALTDLYHPCQVLADVLTMREEFGDLSGLKLSFIGDGNNMAHSLAAGAAVFGYEFVLAAPKGFEPDEEVMTLCRSQGARTSVVTDPAEAAQGANVLYTDVWVSMGQEDEAKERLQSFTGFQVDEKLMKLADRNAIFLHCLPAHRGEEVSAGVIDGPSSRVMRQAENRLHAQKGLLDLLLNA